MYVAVAFIIISIITLIPNADAVPFEIMVLIQNCAIVALLSFMARLVFYEHLQYFLVLFKRRRYAFYDFHAAREIPLAMII